MSSATAIRVAAIGAALVVAHGCATQREAVTGVSNISRATQVAGGIITLGEPLSPVIATVAPGENVVVLPSRAAASAERVIVRLSAANVVSSVTVQYTLGASFDSMVAGYTRSLGAPHRSRLMRQGELPADVAVWLDARTELRLTQDPNRNAWTVQSELSDRTGGNVAP
jgi:hypothetical protein